MQKLRELIKQHRRLADEKSSVSQMRDKANADIDDVIEQGDIQSPRQQKKIGEARFSLDLATTRLKPLDKAIPKLEREIDSLFEAERIAFNRRLKAHREQTEEAIRQALRPYFDEERHLRKTVDKMPIPALHTIGKAHQSRPFNPKAGPEAVVEWAAIFCAAVDRWSAKLNLQS